jgi:hypothetical protein
VSEALPFQGVSLKKKLLIAVGAVIVIAIIAYVLFFSAPATDSVVKSAGLKTSDLQGKGAVYFDGNSFKTTVSREKLAALRAALVDLNNSASASQQEKTKASLLILGINHDLKQDAFFSDIGQTGSSITSEKPWNNCDKLQKLYEFRDKQTSLYQDAIDISVLDFSASQQLGLQDGFLNIDLPEEKVILDNLNYLIGIMETYCGTGGVVQ